MNRLFQEQKAPLIAIVLAAVVALSTIVIVPETQQAVVMRLGEPNRVINRFEPGMDFGNTGAGVTWRLPFAETVMRVDKRMLTVPMERQQVLSIDQQPLVVDAYARFRIIDPARMVRSAGSTDRVVLQLQPIFSSVLRQELGKRTFQSLLTAERGQAMINIRNNLDKQAREYGAQVVDVRIKSADLPDGTPLDSAFARMTAAKDTEATTIISQGQKNAQLIRADAQAQSAQIYANSFGKDPAFYDFWRAMQSYDATFSNQKNVGRSTILLSPDSDYLRQFRGKQ
ncbi:protease modulator HflC [Novosphingobium aquae]|uniref:Protein HflC n=1 Tax=Novosphingobium aquae TaxID=3133435 RepID=A0ABU8SCN2_9SPHN